MILWRLVLKYGDGWFEERKVMKVTFFCGCNNSIWAGRRNGLKGERSGCGEASWNVTAVGEEGEGRDFPLEIASHPIEQSIKSR
jgi:hypothetical protein